MKYLVVAVIAKKWNMSERSVRNYRAQDKIMDAILTGKTWNITGNSVKQNRINARDAIPTTLLEF